MVTQGKPLSLRPSDAVRGGAIPVDMNLEITLARFEIFDYGGKGRQTTAAKLVLQSDEGLEFTQYYSIGPPDRYVPSSDGKNLIPLGPVTAWTDSCNFYVLINSLVAAGFDESKIGSDISLLEGLHAYWEGISQPTRRGLRKEGEAEGMLTVPTKIHTLPWEAKKVAGKATATAKAEAVPADDELVAAAIKVVEELMAKGDPVTRSDLAREVFTGSLANNPRKNDISVLMFADGFDQHLDAAGYKLEGDTISKK